MLLRLEQAPLELHTDPVDHAVEWLQRAFDVTGGNTTRSFSGWLQLPLHLVRAKLAEDGEKGSKKRRYSQTGNSIYQLAGHLTWQDKVWFFQCASGPWFDTPGDTRGAHGRPNPGQISPRLESYLTVKSEPSLPCMAACSPADVHRYLSPNACLTALFRSCHTLMGNVEGDLKSICTRSCERSRRSAATVAAQCYHLSICHETNGTAYDGRAEIGECVANAAESRECPLAFIFQ